MHSKQVYTCNLARLNVVTHPARLAWTAGEDDAITRGPRLMISQTPELKVRRLDSCFKTSQPDLKTNQI